MGKIKAFILLVFSVILSLFGKDSTKFILPEQAEKNVLDLVWKVESMVDDIAKNITAIENGKIKNVDKIQELTFQNEGYSKTIDRARRIKAKLLNIIE